MSSDIHFIGVLRKFIYLMKIRWLPISTFIERRLRGFFYGFTVVNIQSHDSFRFCTVLLTLLKQEYDKHSLQFGTPHLQEMIYFWKCEGNIVLYNTYEHFNGRREIMKIYAWGWLVRLKNSESHYKEYLLFSRILKAVSKYLFVGYVGGDVATACAIDIKMLHIRPSLIFP